MSYGSGRVDWQHVGIASGLLVAVLAVAWLVIYKPASTGQPNAPRPSTSPSVTARPTSAPTVTATPTVVVVPMPGPTRTVQASPRPTATVTRTATPRPSRSPTPRPTPTPSRTCVLFICKESPLDALRCVLCHLDEGNVPARYPHWHHDSQIPLTPCPSCFLGVHECDPGAPWFCSCDCGLDKENR